MMSGASGRSGVKRWVSAVSVAVLSAGLVGGIGASERGSPRSILMASSTRYWVTVLVAAILTAGLSILLLVSDTVPSWIPVVGILVACVTFVWSVFALIKKMPPR